jgi:hypothetical protein
VLPRPLILFLFQWELIKTMRVVAVFALLALAVVANAEVYFKETFDKVRDGAFSGARLGGWGRALGSRAPCV